jgi:hypothetical protein
VVQKHHNFYLSLWLTKYWLWGLNFNICSGWKGSEVSWMYRKVHSWHFSTERWTAYEDFKLCTVHWGWYWRVKYQLPCTSHSFQTSRPFKIKALYSFKMSITTNELTWHNISENFNVHENYYEKLKSSMCTYSSGPDVYGILRLQWRKEQHFDS